MLKERLPKEVRLNSTCSSGADDDRNDRVLLRVVICRLRYSGTDVRTHVPWLSVDEVRCPLSCLTRTTTAATSASHCCASYISHVACVYSTTPRGILIRRCCVNMLLNTTGHVYAVPSCSPFPKLLRSVPTPLRELTALPQTDHTILPLSDTLASLLILFFTVLTLNEYTPRQAWLSVTGSGSYDTIRY